tara:strand:- start:1140 stop:1598 length:459 start_codon:yes stop_codon:yes gene_type:complete
MTTSFIDHEIIRLTKLKNHQNEILAEKTTEYKFLMFLWENSPHGEKIDDLKKTTDEKYVTLKDYYNAGDKFLESKILFFTYFKQNVFPENFIDRMNADMSEYITCSWAYFGMADHKEQRDTVMKEFEFFKTIINSMPVIKKKTRRSGKKHRK